MHIIAAKAVAFGEALKPEFKDYAHQIIKNAAALADELNKLGFDLITGGTSNHLILADVNKSFGVDGKVAADALDAIGLTVNSNVIPDDKLPYFRPSGIRFGTPAITTRGLKEVHMVQIAAWMKRAIVDRDDNVKVAKLRKEVMVFVEGFPLPSDR